ncbi:MFS transporter [Calidifontibacter indicus]|uniref:MFS transporter n=1 Tax=Calidifontibacter indicus TaxID=419650 RepID=UPI003D702A16
MSPAGNGHATTPEACPQRLAALRGGIVGNFVDQVHIFLPLVALAPALPRLAGPHAAAGSATLVVMAMLLGRPVGGLVFGRISDRFGRARTTRWAIAGTALCSLGIAATPPYTVVGVGAMWWILALRFVGGVFIAGEYSAAIPLAMEWSPARRRGLVSGLIMAMAPLAQATIALLTWAALRIDPDAYAAWGWRIAFLGGAIASLGMLAFYRRQVTDREAPGIERIGLRALLVGTSACTFWQLFGLMSGLWMMTNLVVVALPAGLGRAGFDPTQVALIAGVAAVGQAAVMACTGHLSTLTGRRRFFAGWGVLATLAAPPIWLALNATGSLLSALLAATALQAVTVCGYGPVGAYLAEGFPAGIRSTGYGTAYSLSILLPALHPFYLPQVQDTVGRRTAVVALLVLAGVLVAWWGSRRTPATTPQPAEPLVPKEVVGAA